MGPILSSNTRKRYFSDLYIPSYTPPLSVLIKSRKASPHMLERPTLFLVAQSDDALPGVNEEIKGYRASGAQSTVTMRDLVSSEAMPPSVLEGLHSSRLAHFACHGMLETGKPFEAFVQASRGLASLRCWTLYSPGFAMRSSHSFLAVTMRKSPKRA